MPAMTKLLKVAALAGLFALGTSTAAMAASAPVNESDLPGAPWSPIAGDDQDIGTTTDTVQTYSLVYTLVQLEPFAFELNVLAGPGVLAVPEPVPLPAAALLFAGAVGVIGLFGARRRTS